ncbi:MAG: hypothetical protein ACE5WD_03555 [Candidatus Aminicenantia bacterium]
MNKKIILLIILTLILFLLLCANSWATQFKGSSHFSVAKDEVIEGDLFVGGAIINIDGVINGDLFFGGNTININGEVKGDIIGMGGSFTLNGVAGDDVRVWCGSVIINGQIEKSLTAFGGNVVLSKNSLVKRDVFIGGGEAQFKGEIVGELKGGSGTIQLSGIIGKQAELGAEQLTIHPSAKIKGDLKYRARKIDIIKGASIEGKVEKLPFKKKKSKWLNWKFYVFKLLFMIGTIIIGIVLIKLFPKLTGKVSEQVRYYWKSLGIGFVVLVCLPIATALVAITIIGIPLAIILFLFYFLFLYIGKIFVSLVAGEEILKSRESASLWALILGIVIFTILFNIPYVGWLIRLLTMILGLGALSVGSFKALKRA